MSDRWAVHHGECLAVLNTLESNSVDAVITDPPYSSGGAFRSDRMQPTDIKYMQSNSSRVEMQQYSGDNRDQRSFHYWCALWLSECLRIAKPGAPIVVFTDWRQLPTTTDSIQAGGWVWRGIGVWVKKSARPQMGRFASQCEYFAWGSNGSMPQNEDVGCLPGAFTIQASNLDKQQHATAKPLELMREVVKITPPGGTILDPFCGSGTTGAAAVGQGFSFIGIEQEEHYAKAARQRIENAVQQGRQKELALS
jgi:site-specific DNA-methyltransferase (adenine-specific)